jgi:hypothetical protein
MEVSVSGTNVRSNVDETAAQKNIIHRKKWQNTVVRSRQLYFAGVRKNVGLLANCFENKLILMKGGNMCNYQ